MLDPVQQRIVGVLIEKERTVPDAYPLTEAALLAGCNQKSNRDPELDLDNTELHPALLALREDGWVARVEGNRAARYRHRVEERLNVNADEIAVLCELLCRGPQAPGALKPRVARLGLDAEPARIEEILTGLAAHSPTPLVERLPRQPRERDHRWGHRLGPRPASSGGAAAAAPVAGGTAPARAAGAAGAVPPSRWGEPVVDDDPGFADEDHAASDTVREELEELRSEVAALRSRVDDLEAAVRELRGY